MFSTSCSETPFILRRIQRDITRAPPSCRTVSQVPMRTAGAQTPSIGSSRSPPSHMLHTIKSVVQAIFIQLFWFPTEQTVCNKCTLVDMLSTRYFYQTFI
jgi:hypothetical protein